MTLGLALITIVINDGVVEDDGRYDNLQIVKETYNISYIASKVMPLENLARCTQSLDGVLQYKHTHIEMCIKYILEIQNLARYKVLTVFSNTNTHRNVY